MTHHGQPLRIPWVRDGALPVWMAAYGPRALRLAGEQADGFILQTADPDIARWTFGSVRAAAAAAGRDPASITMCVAAPAYVGPDLPHQREQLRWFGGMVGNHVADLVARYGTDGPVPRVLTDYIAGRQAYDYEHHGGAATRPPTSCRMRSWTGSACSARPRRTSSGCASWPRSAPTSSPSTSCTTTRKPPWTPTRPRSSPRCGYALASSPASASRPSGPRLRAAVCQRLRSKPGCRDASARAASQARSPSL